MKVKNLKYLLLVMSLSLPFSSCKDDEETKTEEPVKYTFTVNTTVSESGSNYYNGLTLQAGLSGSTDVIAEAVVSDGKAVFCSTKDLASEISGKDVWFGVKGMVKFFHTMTEKEIADSSLTLPDKELGSSLSGDTNDWIVALYMGVNKDGKSDGVPIYWATGNLIAVKTSEAGEPTKAVFHIATAAENAEESNPSTTEFVGLSKLLKRKELDGYVDIPKGRKWDVYCFGDKTGLMLYDGTELDDFVTDSKQMVGDKIVYDISGDKDFDIATNLGGLWRTPTGGKTGLNEFAAFEDSFEEYAQMLPNHEPVGTPGENFSVNYKHTVVIDSKEVCVNTLNIPSAGYRHALAAMGRGSFVGLWSSTADPTCTEVFYGNTGEEMPDIKVEPQTTAFAYSSLVKQTTWYAHPRTSSIAIRPVTE
ncbi:MAG: hypothetical protein II956_03780 [Bacteroidales bacterium]|nr:hypothetical protein [Bacteroidales bacterium]